ncbi:MAG: hypothetical protein WC505_05875 [Patescibacteria group bacterium]
MTYTFDQYPVGSIVAPGETPYWITWLPDWSWTTCSATGDTLAEALADLQDVYNIVLQYYRDHKLDIPVPTTGPAAHELILQSTREVQRFLTEE